ncbi:receptor-like protein EIX2 [Typha angustifolia]|uniref:receptor-like protein EIX2 n=1 Tax=Typha angustifolia TaxID=59011 RepID=UPI003C2C4686
MFVWGGNNKTMAKLTSSTTHGVLVLSLCLLLLQIFSPALSLETTKLRGSCVASERDALLTFKEGINTLHGSLLSSWEGHDCCRWRGVLCSNKTGHVVKLDLRVDPEEFQWASMSGNISPSLLALEHLNYLDLSFNYFGGQQIPKFMGSFKNLKYLNLSNAGFGGSIPPSLLALERLNYLDLSFNNFGGHQIPKFMGSFKNLKYLYLSNANFGGSVPPQLGNLTKLLHLDLGDNSLQSVDLVAWLPRLSSLKHLDMSYVNLSAAVDWVPALSMLPASLRVLHLSVCSLNATLSALPLYSSNLTALVTLDLENNYFHGPIPDGLLGNMTSLKELWLGLNDLVGMIPKTMKNLHKLKVFDLRWNQISGDIAELMERLSHKIQSLYLMVNNLNGSLPTWIENMTSLSTLDLGYNGLTGSIPSGMGKLTNLSYLDLSSNQLVGMILEDHFTNLTRLEVLYLSNNSLTMEVHPNWIPPFRLKEVDLSYCKLGPHFPAWIQSQTNITFLYMSSAGITDMLPNWFWNVISQVEYLDLSLNLISGAVPKTLEFLSAARIIMLNSNQFQGQVPQLPSRLWFFDLSRNNISGPLLLNLGTVELRYLLLSTNHISGTIPSSMCDQLQSLIILDLSNNLLLGHLPQCWTSSNSFKADPSELRPTGSNVDFISFRNNSLSGKFPLFIRSCQQLSFLDLSYNNFSGNLPVWIGTRLPNLVFLLLKSNMFSGYIPIKLSKLDHLQVLDLAHNNLSGTIAPSVNFKAMTLSFNLHTSPAYIFGELEDYDDSISFSVDTKGQILEYHNDEIFFMLSLDLSGNILTGEIPKEIGALAGLTNLNLSANRLTGNIPDSIGGLQSLESLDLSNNELFGEIPSTLSALTFLSHLNLSYNNLSGRIPSDGQLETFEDPTIYIGNKNLCGPPTSKNCLENQTTMSDLLEYEDGYDMSSFYLSMGLGYAVGFWVIFGTLLFNRTWRTTYFLFIDNMCDRIYVFVVLKWGRFKASIRKK